MSKYDTFWQESLIVILGMIRTAQKTGESITVDASAELGDLGDRESWYGKVKIDNGEVIAAKNAHAVSLGNVLADSLDENSGRVDINISATGSIQAVKVEQEDK